MKKTILCLLVLTSLFIGCNQRSVSENDDTILEFSVDSNVNEISETNIDYILEASGDTIISIYPESFEEEIIDSLLDIDKNIRLIIKISTRMDKYVSKVYVLDSNRIEKYVYRDKAISFNLLVDDAIRLDTTILKENLTQIGDEDFLKQSTMHRAWIRDYDRVNNTIYTRFNATVPDTDWAYAFVIVIDIDGNCKIELEYIE